MVISTPYSDFPLQPKYWTFIRCFCKMLWKNVNECFGQPSKSQLFAWTFTLCNKTDLAFISFSNLTYNNLATPRTTFSLVLHSPNSLLGQCVFHYFSLHLNCLCCSECAFADNPSWGTLTPSCSLLDTLCYLHCRICLFHLLFPICKLSTLLRGGFFWSSLTLSSRSTNWTTNVM